MIVSNSACGACTSCFIEAKRHEAGPLEFTVLSTVNNSISVRASCRSSISNFVVRLFRVARKRLEVPAASGRRPGHMGTCHFGPVYPLVGFGQCLAWQRHSSSFWHSYTYSLLKSVLGHVAEQPANEPEPEGRQEVWAEYNAETTAEEDRFSL